MEIISRVQIESELMLLTEKKKKSHEEKGCEANYGHTEISDWAPISPSFKGFGDK